MLAISKGYRINEFAKRIGRAPGTVRRWEREGILAAKRLPKDRLVRFRFDLLDRLARENGCEFIVVNQDSLSPEQEMVEDLLAIVHMFSCRLHGLGKVKKQIKEDYLRRNEPKEILE